MLVHPAHGFLKTDVKCQPTVPRLISMARVRGSGTETVMMESLRKDTSMEAALSLGTGLHNDIARLHSVCTISHECTQLIIEHKQEHWREIYRHVRD